MARSLSEATVFSSVVESAFGTAGTSGWRRHLPNTIDKFGSMYRSVAQDPIGGNRQLQGGEIVDIEAPTEWSCDFTKDVMDHFAEGIFMASAVQNGGTGLAYFTPTSATTTEYVVAASGALQASTLVHARGFLQTANNGLKVVGAMSTGTNIKVAGLAAETVSGYLATVEVAGFRGASGDIQLDASGDLICTAANFTTMGLVAGQWIWVGGTIGGATAFATSAYRGFAQIKTIAALKLTLARRNWTVAAPDNGAGKTIDLYWGRWITNTSAQHARYLERSYTFETVYQTLAAGPAAAFEYSQGNLLSTVVINLPATDKATMDLQFVGATSIDPSTTRLTGASTAFAPLSHSMMNTSTHMYRLRMSNVDETGLTTDIKSMKVTLTNSVTRETVLGYAGARYLNVGDFIATIEGEYLFSNEAFITGVRDKRTVQLDFSLRNGEGGYLFDFPAMKIDSADKKFTSKSSVTLQGKTTGIEDTTYGITCGVTMFPFLPAA